MPFGLLISKTTMIMMNENQQQQLQQYTPIHQLLPNHCDEQEKNSNGIFMQIHHHRHHIYELHSISQIEN